MLIDAACNGYMSDGKTFWLITLSFWSGFSSGEAESFTTFLCSPSTVEPSNSNSELQEHPSYLIRSSALMPRIILPSANFNSSSDITPSLKRFLPLGFVWGRWFKFLIHLNLKLSLDRLRSQLSKVNQIHPLA